MLRQIVGWLLVLLSVPILLLGLLNVVLSPSDSYPNLHPNMLELGLIVTALGVGGMYVGVRVIRGPRKAPAQPSEPGPDR